MMLKLVRELTDIVLRHPGVVIAPLDRELSPDGAREILGVSRPLVFRRMDNARRADAPPWPAFKTTIRQAGLLTVVRARWDEVEPPSRSRFLIEHDLFGKPLHTFPDHALVKRQA